MDPPRATGRSLASRVHQRWLIHRRLQGAHCPLNQLTPQRAVGVGRQRWIAADVLDLYALHNPVRPRLHCQRRERAQHDNRNSGPFDFL
jgi:hypothetical protein